MRAWAVVVMLLAAVATAAWVPGGRAHAEADQLRIDWIGMIDTANALPAESWLASFALVNDTPYTWTYPMRGGEPELDRWVESLGGWEPLPNGGYHGGTIDPSWRGAEQRGRIRPGEKIPFLVYGSFRRGVQRVQIEFDHRSAHAPVIAVSRAIDRSLAEEQPLPQQPHGFEHARPR